MPTLHRLDLAVISWGGWGWVGGWGGGGEGGKGKRQQSNKKKTPDLNHPSQFSLARVWQLPVFYLKMCKLWNLIAWRLFSCNGHGTWNCQVYVFPSPIPLPIPLCSKQVPPPSSQGYSPIWRREKEAWIGGRGAGKRGGSPTECNGPFLWPTEDGKESNVEIPSKRHIAEIVTSETSTNHAIDSITFIMQVEFGCTGGWNALLQRTSVVPNVESRWPREGEGGGRRGWRRQRETVCYRSLLYHGAVGGGRPLRPEWSRCWSRHTCAAMKKTTMKHLPKWWWIKCRST